MDEFQYIWEVFALLISLAVAEMLGGFAAILKLRARRKAGVLRQAQDDRETALPAIRIGWLVPSLGALVLVDLATFFMIMWSARAVLDMEMATVLGVLVLLGAYYLVASLVFPDEPELWPDFDTYYWLQKRYVVFGILAINLVSGFAIGALGGQALEGAQAEAIVRDNPMFAVSSMVLILNYPAFLWLALSKRPRVNLALMWFILLTQFVYAVSTWGIDGLS